MLASTFSVTDKTDGKKLCSALRKIAVADNPATVQQIIQLEFRLSEIESSIEEQEAQINDALFAAYHLTAPDIELIKKSR